MIRWSSEDLQSWQREVLRSEAEEKITRTFRRLDPDRQRAVVEAILAEAAERGPQGLNVAGVAARAGIAVGSLYRYFPSRDGMLLFAAEVAAGFLTDSLDRAAGQACEMPLASGLETYLAGGVEWSGEHSGLLTFFLRAAYEGTAGFGEPLVRPVARAVQGLLRALLEGARRRGELAADVDVDLAVRLVCALTTPVIDAELLPHLNDYYQLFDDRHDAAAVRAGAVRFIVRAIGT